MKTSLSFGVAAAIVTTWATFAGAQQAPASGSSTTTTPPHTTTATPTAAPTTPTAPAAPMTTTTTPPATTQSTQTTVVVPTSTTTTTSSTIYQPVESSRDALPKEQTTFLNRPLFTSGLIVLGGTYGASVIVAATNDRPEDDKLYIPVAGPWLDLNDRDCNARPCGNKDLDTALLIADGIGQGIGALAMVTSLFVPEKTTKGWYLVGDDKLHVSPSRVGYYGSGVMAGGKF